MKKVLARVSAFCLAGVMALAMSACGNTGGQGDTGVDESGNAKPLKSATLKFTLPGDVAPQSQAAVLKAVEEKLKADTGITTRCMPFEDQERVSETCVCCGRKAQALVYWGKAY